MTEALKAAIAAIPSIKNNKSNNIDIPKLISKKYKDLVRDTLESGIQHLKNTAIAIGSSNHLTHTLPILFERATNKPERTK